MKITAHFDSPDSADFAAGAVARALSTLTSVKTESRGISSPGNNMNAFASFNTLSITPPYSIPIYIPSVYTSRIPEGDKRKLDYSVQDNILEIVCSRDEAAAASNIIVSHGGRNISKL